MYHYIEAITNTKGDALFGYYVRAVNDDDSVESIYADASLTPISTVSGVADAAKVDSNGNASFYIAPGIYHLDIYAKDATTLLKRIEFIDMGSAIITLATGSTVSTRTAMAAIEAPVAGQVASLAESGREGVFTFSASDLSASVALDPNQGLFVAPSTAPSGASGAWVRQFDVPHVGMFGAVRSVDGTIPSDSVAAINAAIDTVTGLGMSRLDMLPGLYTVNGKIYPRSGLHLYAKGAEIRGAGAQFWSVTPLEDITLEGVNLVETSGANNIPGFFFRETIQGLRMLDTSWQRDPAAGGYLGAIYSADDVIIDGFVGQGTNGVWCEGKRWVITNFRMTADTAGDDCWVIKSNDSLLDAGSTFYDTADFVISNGYAEGFTNVVGLGSEVGKYAANDSAYSRRIANVTITNCVGVNCSNLVTIKPGGVAGVDYRDGTVENVTISNCTLEDLSGTQFRAGISIVAGRGGRVRNVRISNVVVRARAINQSAPNCGVYIAPYDYTGGTAASRVEDIYINNMSVIDHYAGAAHDGSHPGYPIDFGVYIERQIGSGGTAPVIGRIEFKDFTLNGSCRNGVYIGSSVTGPVRFNGAEFRNYANGTAAAADKGMVSALSAVSFKNIESTPSSSAPSGTRGGSTDVAGSAEITGEIELVRLPSVVAGTAYQASAFVAPRDCWIRKVEIVTDAAVTQNNTNYVVMSVRGMGTGNLFAAKNTTITSGIALAASTPASLNASSANLAGADVYLTKGQCLRFEFSHGGAGQAISLPTFIVHYLPYGAA